MCDMPTLLLRMRICEEHSLEELVSIFNYILSKIQRQDGPLQPQAAALYHFPKVFSEPRDQYIASFLHEVCNETKDGEGYSQVNAYIGNVHVKPISRLWQTAKSKSSLSVSEPKSVGAKKKNRISLNYIDHCRLPDIYSNDPNSEKAEIKISKHALLEALFQTKAWMQPYVRNPFIYISDNDSDFNSPEGQQLNNYFKRVFYDQFTKYNNALIEA